MYISPWCTMIIQASFLLYKILYVDFPRRNELMIKNTIPYPGLGTQPKEKGKRGELNLGNHATYGLEHA